MLQKDLLEHRKECDALQKKIYKELHKNKFSAEEFVIKLDELSRLMVPCDFVMQEKKIFAIISTVSMKGRTLSFVLYKKHILLVHALPKDILPQILFRDCGYKNQAAYELALRIILNPEHSTKLPFGTPHQTIITVAGVGFIWVELSEVRDITYNNGVTRVMLNNGFNIAVKTGKRTVDRHVKLGYKTMWMMIFEHDNTRYTSSQGNTNRFLGLKNVSPYLQDILDKMREKEWTVKPWAFDHLYNDLSHYEMLMAIGELSVLQQVSQEMSEKWGAWWPYS